MNKYRMIGVNGSVYVSRLNRYPNTGEVLELTDAEAAVLLSPALIEPVAEDMQVQDLPDPVSTETPAVEDVVIHKPKNKRSMSWQN